MADETERAINIIVGAGGTGAKVIEATLIQLMSGMVEMPVHVGIVDQDVANGNVDRAARLLSRQKRFRELWSGTENNIEWGSGELPALGHNGVHPLFASGDALYRPNSAGDTLQQMIGRGLSKPQEYLFDMLFMNNEEEQLLPLDEGYRGRAHVGSAAFISALAGEKNELFDAIERIVISGQGVPVNVFFVGSAFGGTGAAGFPTLARRLHRLREKKAYAHAEQIRIGGLLMLPYFNFDSPDEEQDAVVTPDELLPKTQMALEYYHNLFKHERSFDMFYALGWPEQYPLGYHEPGAKEQANPALPTELMAATAAVHFFRRMTDYAEEDSTVTFLSSHDDNWIDWRDLPNDAPSEQEQMLKMGQLLRFCVFWKYLFEPQLKKPLKTSMFGGAKPNTEQKLADGVHPSDAVEEMETLSELIESILHWFATVEATAGRVSGGQRLWTMQRAVDASNSSDDPCNPVRVYESIAPERAEMAFDELIFKEESGAESRTAANVYEELIEDRQLEQHEGLGKAVVQVYDACRLR